MRVLFGMSSDDTVKSIVKFYEEKYGEKIEYKIAYYFGQFRQEIANGDYDRAVLSEELEKLSTRSYAEADKQLFEYIDGITNSFEAKNLIYIASERRKLGDEFLAKLFVLGVYTTLTGSDRTKGKVCAAIETPTTKKEARKYYGNLTPNQIYNKAEVKELELKNIIAYFKNLNGDTTKYNEIFERVVNQYTTEQMGIIIQYLPQDVKEYLEKNSKAYKNIIESSGIKTSTATQQQPQQQTQIINKDAGSNGIEIQSGKEIAQKIVVKEPVEKIVEKKVIQEKVITQVVEKKVVEQYFDVPEDYKKTVCFVGAPKTGTTFCINAIGTYLAKQKIKTAMVDLTRKRDLYTIYTYDNTGKRNIAGESLRYASSGKNEPLVYEKLSVYTAVPGEDRKSYNPNVLVDTIVKNNNVVLIDADFSTPLDYFRLAQDIYIVQDMNVLNINQITIFLRELKQRGIGMEKVKIIINKYVNCALSSKDIIDGIATYTSYDLKMFDELFNPKRVQYFILPFDVENYTKYVEMVYKYSNKFSSFTKNFQENLNEIINSIYPTKGKVSIEEEHYTEEGSKKGKGFGLFKKK
ncbi:MAG: hypothetical protein J6A15_10140 [Clostridia bacterium]|nr:hypothetical protein [Clostridia bacterium]